jgi:hypothetical protein
MQKTWSRILEILDGAPAVKTRQESNADSMSKGARGQSLLEMAFITPLLVILFAGLVEIGWLANNYLNILDVTRYGARRGTTLTDERTPLSWDNAYSWVPNTNVSSRYQMSYISSLPGDWPAEEDRRFRHREEWAIAITTRPGPDPLPPLNIIPTICGNRNDFLFYSDIICTMLQSIPPLRMNPYNGVDDIVVSAFSLALVDLSDPQAVSSEATSDRWAMPFPNRPVTGQVPQLIVAGRYPTNANECQANEAGTPAATIYDPRDPFDINGNGEVDTRVIPAVTIPGFTYNINWFNEITGYDLMGTSTVDDNGTPADFEDDIITYNSLEKHVGFVWYGNHVIEGTSCIGSEWSLREIEDLVNLESFAATVEQRRRLPNQGIVLVEFFWEHEMLLQIPVLSPVFEAFSRDGRPDLELWAMFPLPSVEPYVDYKDPS